MVDLDHRLRQWKREYADPVGQPFEVPAMVGASDTQLRIFQCRDFPSGEVITPTLIAYPDPELARALCLYYAALLTISLVDIRTERGIPPHEQYKLACLICRSTEYFIQTVPNHSTRVLGPLRVAYDTLPEGGIERQWVQELFQLLGKAEHMNATKTLARDFSVQTTAS